MAEPKSERRSYSGNAVETAIVGTIAAGATSLTLASATGWPTGSVGPAEAEFYTESSPGVIVTLEKIKYTNLSGTSMSGITRGHDSTVAAERVSGTKIRHVWTADSADLANKHAADSAQAELDHTGLLNNTRHDTTTRHTWGTVIPASSTATDLGSTSGGSGSSGSKGDHAHGFPSAAAYTPTLGGGTIGNGTFVARQLKVGKMLYVSVNLTIGSSTSLSGTVTISLPSGVTAVAGPTQYLPAQTFNLGTGGIAPARATLAGGATAFNITSSKANAANPSMALVSSTYPGAWANFDSIEFSGWVEVQ